LKYIHKRHRLTISAIALVLVAISGYFFIYLQGKQNEIKERDFRVLQRISSNLLLRIKSFDALSKNVTEIAGDAIRADEQEQKKNKPVLKITGNEKAVVSGTERKTAKIKKAFRGLTNMRFHSVKVSDTSFTHPVIFPDGNESKYLFSNLMTEAGKRYEFLVSEILVRDMLKPLLREDIFQDYILFNSDSSGKLGIIYESFPTGLNITSRDSVLLPLNGFETSTVKEMEIGGLDYKVFMQPVRLDSYNTVVIAGLIKKSDYKADISTLPSNAIIGILIVIALIILGMPFLKVLMMSANERLGSQDVILSGISLVLGTSLAVFVLFYSYISLGPDTDRKEMKLTALSSSITDNFLGEIKLLTAEMDKYECLVAVDSQKRYKPDPRLNIYNVFYVDSMGQQTLKYGPGAEINVHDRAYFRDVMKGKTWLGSGALNGIYVDPVISWTKGDFRVVVSRRNCGGSKCPSSCSGELPVIGISASLRSVMEPVMPFNYGFCIMDRNGEVLFHSDKDKNLNENFIDECGRVPELVSAVQVRNNNFFSCRYSGRDCEMMVSPVNGCPLYLVIFTDKTEGRILNTQVFGFTMMISFGLFAFLSAIILLACFFRVRHTKLRIPQFDLSVLIPVKRRSEHYLHACIFNTLLMVLLLSFTHTDRPLFTIYLFFISVIYFALANYLFLRSGSRPGWNDLASRRIALVIAAILILVMNIAACRVIGSYFSLFAEQLLVIVIFLIVFFLPKKSLRILSKISFQGTYSLMVLSWLVVMSILPAVKFCEMSYNQENSIAARYAQLYLAEELNRRSDGAWSIDSEKKYKNVYTAGDAERVSSGEKEFRQFKAADEFPEEENIYTAYLNGLRPYYRINSPDNTQLLNHSYDNSWQWKKNERMICMSYHDQVSSPSGNCDTLSLTSAFNTYSYPKPWEKVNGSFNFKGSLFWLSAIIALMALYFIIHFFINKLFILDLLVNKKLARADRVFLEQDVVNKRIFLTGLPYSGKTDFFENTDYFKKNGTFRIDMVDVNVPDLWQERTQAAKMTDKKVIIADHFEYNCLNPEVNRKKLDFLEELQKAHDKTIIIISTIHPAGFLEMYRNADLSPEGKIVFLQDEDRWNKLLINFYKFYYPLQGMIRAVRDKEIPSYLDKECNNGMFLQGLKESLAHTVKHDSGLAKEEVILKIQSLAHTYYLAIWSMLTKEEQYIVYDLAQDGLVNPKNIETITLLLNKGIVIYDGTLKLMNQSFRNFVLSTVKQEDALRVEGNNHSGAWSRYKAPIILILGSVSIFIFVTQQDSFSNVLAYATTVTAGLPLILKMVNSFSTVTASK
jgi:hypothetical protein